MGAERGRVGNGRGDTVLLARARLVSSTQSTTLLGALACLWQPQLL